VTQFKFTKYLQSIGMGRVLIDRLTAVHRFYSSVIPEPIEDLFVSDYVNEDGTRSHESAWFFSLNYIAEARTWPSSDDLDVLKVRGIHYWRLQKEEYEFDRKPKEASRMRLEFSVGPSNSAALRAAKNNCAPLKAIFLKYVVKRMVAPDTG
jgi:hypothetical protein